MGGDGGARSKEAVRRAVEQAKELQDVAAAHVARSSGEEQSIRQRTLVLDSSMRRLRDSIGFQASSRLLDSKLADRLEDELRRARCIMADGNASSFLPSKARDVFYNKPILSFLKDIGRRGDATVGTYTHERGIDDLKRSLLLSAVTPLRNV